MEPFELTLQQVTFEEGEFSPQPELDSFDTVVNYDTHFESSIGTTFQGTSALSYSYTDVHRSRGVRNMYTMYYSLGLWCLRSLSTIFQL